MMKKYLVVLAVAMSLAACGPQYQSQPAPVLYQQPAPVVMQAPIQQPQVVVVPQQDHTAGAFAAGALMGHLLSRPAPATVYHYSRPTPVIVNKTVIVKNYAAATTPAPARQMSVSPAPASKSVSAPRLSLSKPSSFGGFSRRK